MTRRLIILTLLLAVLWPAPTASAHGGYLRQAKWAGERLEQRIDAYRVRHGRTIVLPNLQTYTANVALSIANWSEGRWRTGIGPDPFPVWSATIYGPTRGRAILKTIRCEGRPYTPYQALISLRNWSSYYRAVMLWDGWLFGSVRAVRVHKHAGWFKGKGECRAYYVSFAT
jgi:hypothetical protein